MSKSRKLAGLIASIAVGIGLLGGGVYATFSDAGTATENLKVGTFGITVTSSTPGAVVVNSGTTHTVTLDAGTLMKSDAGSAPLAFTVNTTGTIPVNVHVGVSTPTAPFTSILNPPADVVLNPSNLKQDYAGGLQWPALTNADLGKNTSVVYTISASEGPYVPPIGTMTHIGNTYTIRVNTCGGQALVPGDILATYRGSWSNGWAGLGPSTGGLATVDSSGVIYWTGLDNSATIPGSGTTQFSLLSGPTTIRCTLTSGL
jgi:Camelysin metallo-endopeptidase